jgi:hypothetical protein
MDISPTAVERAKEFHTAQPGAPSNVTLCVPSPPQISPHSPIRPQPRRGLLHLPSFLPFGLLDRIRLHLLLCHPTFMARTMGQAVRRGCTARRSPDRALLPHRCVLPSSLLCFRFADLSSRISEQTANEKAVLLILSPKKPPTLSCFPPSSSFPLVLICSCLRSEADPSHRLLSVFHPCIFPSATPSTNSTAPSSL